MVVDLPRFDVGDTDGGSIVRRGVPAMRIGGQLVTTVLDLMLAQYGVGATAYPASGRPDMTTRIRSGRRPGRNRSPRSIAAIACVPRESSPETPS